MRVITRGTLKISRAIWAAMMLRLSPLVREAKPSAVSMPARRSTSSSMPFPSIISPLKSLPSRSKACRLLSITVTWCPARERALATIAPTRPQPTITIFIKPGSPILRSPAEHQARSFDLGQSRGADLLLGGHDVIRHAVKANGRASKIDEREGRIRITVPRLTHTARVDERGRWQRNPVARRRNLFPLLGKDSWQMRVAEEAEPLAKAHQDFKRLQVVEDVLPEIRLARASVHEAMTAQPAVRRESRQIAPALRGEHRLAPARRRRGVWVKPVEQRGRQHGGVVIAQDRSGADRAKAIDDGI